MTAFETMQEGEIKIRTPLFRIPDSLLWTVILRAPRLLWRVPWRPRFNPWVRKSPWRRKWQPSPVLLPGKSHGKGRGTVLEVWTYKCSPFCRLRIKVTFLFSPNSTSVFFIQLWWAEKAKILASNNSMMAIQLQLYFCESVVGAGRLYMRRVAQIGHHRPCRWADHSNKNMLKTSEHLPKRNCCKISEHNSTLFVLVLWRIRLQCRRPRFDSWVRKIHWRRDRLPTPVFLGLGSQRVGHNWVTFTSS